MYQFILLDQIDGRRGHVQWGADKEYRWVRRIWFNEEIEPVKTKYGSKLPPQGPQATYLDQLDTTLVDDDYKLQVTMQMASVQEEYRNMLLYKSPINVAYMTVMKKMMLSPYKLDWEFVETLTNFMASLLEPDSTINKEELEKQLEDKIEYKDIIKVFEQYQ
jgi:hypothetical protein